MISQPLTLRMRPDLQVFPQSAEGRPAWVVKDPVSLRYHHLANEEFAILQWLNGERCLEEVRGRYEQEFAPQRLSKERLYAFLGDLHRQGLLLSDTTDQDEPLLERGTRRRRHERLQGWLNILALRFHGIDPTPMISVLYPRIRWLLAPWCIALCHAFIVAALGLVLVQFDVLWSRSPELNQFCRPGNLLWVAVSLAIVKVLHELGHAVACRHFGGECHEMGFMLLVLTPCLYCDVSDSWTLASRWHRIAIAAAGVYVELLIASICTFLWWFSEPGWLNQMCLNTMFVCSVGTVLFNGNPLLRYDGYYVLSDLLAVPNLGDRSRALVHNTLARWCLGVALQEDAGLPTRHRAWLATYALLSIAYRWCILIAVLFFLHRVLEPYRLERLTHLLAVVAVGGLLTPPLIQWGKRLRHPQRRRDIRRWRLLVSTLGLAGVVATVAWIPLPYRIDATLIVQPENLRYVYAPLPGRLKQCVSAGGVVAQGDGLAVLVNRDIESQLVTLRGQRQQLQSRLASLEARRTYSAAAAVQIPTVREELNGICQRLLEREAEARRLTVTAAVRGVVFPPPSRRGRDLPYQLATWHGSPLAEENLGCTIEMGTLLCVLGDPDEMQAVLTVDRADIEFVQVKQRVRLQLDQLPGQQLSGVVREIAHTSISESERMERERGPLKPAAGTDYQVMVSFDASPPSLRIGGGGRAKIIAHPQPIGSRIYRYLARTFAMPL